MSRAALRALQVTLRLADLLTKPAPAWHELMFGQLHVQLSWTELAATGHADAAPVPLTLTTARLRAPAAAPSPGKRSAGRPTASPDWWGAADRPSAEVPKAAPAPAPAQKAKVMAPPPRQPAAAAVVAKVLPPPAPADEIEEVEEYTDDDDEFEPDSPPKPPPPNAAAASAARGAPAGARPAAIEYWEYTHRGGTGNGPKENQDTYFTIKIDEDNWVFAVLDGHGGDNGRIASQAASPPTLTPSLSLTLSLTLSRSRT